MPNLPVLEVIEKGELILAIDDAAAVGNPFILHAVGSHTNPKRQRGRQPVPSLTLRVSVSPHVNVSVLAAWSMMESANERVRLFYGSCSDLREKTPELAKIGFQPKRDAGEAQEQPEPGTPGPVTYDAAAETLSVAVMRDHSTTLRANRQPLGGAAELVGSSLTTTVSVVQFGPLTCGVNYEFWLVGHTQSVVEASQSNHVTHAVPVGP